MGGRAAVRALRLASAHESQAGTNSVALVLAVLPLQAPCSIQVHNAAAAAALLSCMLLPSRAAAAARHRRWQTCETFIPASSVSCFHGILG